MQTGNTDGMKRRKYRNYAGKCLNPIRILDTESNVKSKILKKINSLRTTYFFRDEITFLRRQLREALGKQVNTSAYPSSSTAAVNVNEPPVNEDQARPKPKEKGIHSDSKNKNIKEKPITETNNNSKANNNVKRLENNNNETIMKAK